VATVYVRHFNLNKSLNDDEVLGFWKFMIEELKPAVEEVNGINSVKYYSGAGALRADLRLVIDMGDGGAYERLLHDSTVRRLLARMYAALDLDTSTQLFNREIDSELIAALSSAVEELVEEHKVAGRTLVGGNLGAFTAGLGLGREVGEQIVEQQRSNPNS